MNKPCPFCGVEPEILPSGKTAYCNKCQVGLPLEAWNLRASPPPAEPGLLANDVLVWMKTRPGVSWEATINDVERAIATLARTPPPAEPGLLAEAMGAMRGLVRGIDEWNASVEAVIGHQRDYKWTSLEMARDLLARYDARTPPQMSLEDEAEKAADEAGVWGAGPEASEHPDDCKCRMCFVECYRQEHPRTPPPAEPGLRLSQGEYDSLVRDAMKWRASPHDETVAWLIEDPVGHPLKFWLPNPRTGVDWTDDANKAVRFLRHNDANAVMAARPDMNELWVARDHMWVDALTPPQKPAETLEYDRHSDLGHFKRVCKKCGTVIAQCRCMDCNKTVVHSICDKCKTVHPDYRDPESNGGTPPQKPLCPYYCEPSHVVGEKCACPCHEQKPQGDALPKYPVELRCAEIEEALRELLEAVKRLPANDGRVIGLIPIITRADAALRGDLPVPPEGGKS